MVLEMSDDRFSVGSTARGENGNPKFLTHENLLARIVLSTIRSPQIKQRNLNSHKGHA
jgi:hypothetical protein